MLLTRRQNYSFRASHQENESINMDYETTRAYDRRQSNSLQSYNQMKNHQSVTKPLRINNSTKGF